MVWSPGSMSSFSLIQTGRLEDTLKSDVALSVYLTDFLFKLKPRRTWKLLEIKLQKWPMCQLIAESKTTEDPAWIWAQSSSFLTCGIHFLYQCVCLFQVKYFLLVWKNRVQPVASLNPLRKCVHQCKQRKFTLLLKRSLFWLGPLQRCNHCLDCSTWPWLVILTHKWI